MQYRQVGDTGVEVSILGIGTMRFKGRENAVDIIRRAIRLGLTYIDCGAAYSWKSFDENAEAWVGEAIRGVPRGKLVLSAKAQPRPGEPRLERNLGINTRDHMWKCIEQSLQRVGVDYFDFYQFWDMSAEEHFDAACVGKDSPLAALREARDQGIVRHIGFTTHAGSDEAKEWISRVPEFRFVTLYYNFANRFTEEAVTYAHERSVGVATMGSLYGGLLTGESQALNIDLPELHGRPVHEIAFRFLFSNPGVSTALSGMNDPDHLKENAAIASDAKALSPGQCERFIRAFQEFTDGQELCTGCRYCFNACPLELPIYRLMNVYQLYQILGVPAGEEQFEQLKRQDKIDPSKCEACGKCTEQCPQHLPVARRMKHLAELLGK